MVEGGDIHIKTNIEYTGSDKILLLIARKNNNGQGGNVIVDPSVTRIDATIIADGGVLTSSDINPGERLVINGSLYSYNTRGGSFAVSGTNLINSTTPKKFTNSTLTSASNLADSQDEDLERFRPMFADGSTQCSLHINYQAFTMTTLPALLKRPGSYVGGSCGF